jgi:IS30 family transposase
MTNVSITADFFRNRLDQMIDLRHPLAVLANAYIRDDYLGIQWSSVQVAGKVAVSHECVYLHVYANKAAGGDLHKHLRIQKPRRKRHLSGRDRRGQIPNRRSISERPSHIEDRKQVATGKVIPSLARLTNNPS